MSKRVRVQYPWNWLNTRLQPTGKILSAHRPFCSHFLCSRSCHIDNCSLKYYYTGIHPTNKCCLLHVTTFDRMIKLSDKVTTSLNDNATRLDLSPRAYHRIIKLARTTADLEESRYVEESHIMEALQYRPKRLFA